MSARIFGNRFWDFFSSSNNPDPPYLSVLTSPHISICFTSFAPLAPHWCPWIPLEPLCCPKYTHPSSRPFTQTYSDPLEALCESRPHPVQRTQFCPVCYTKQCWRPRHASKPPQTPLSTKTWSNSLCTLCALLTGDVMDLLWHLNNKIWLHIKPMQEKKLPQVTDCVCSCVSDVFNHPSSTERAFLPFFSTNYHHWQWWILILTRWLSRSVVAPRCNSEKACLRQSWGNNNATYGALWSNCKHPKYFHFNGKHAPSSRVWEAASKSH